MSKPGKPVSADISVVVPARNEAADIVSCLEALAAQDLPYGDYEVLVVDGASTDGTAELARQALEHLGMVGRVLSNEAATTPSNLNAGLHAALGRILCRVDARSLVPPAYLRTCRDLLDRRPDVAVVGGRQVAVVQEHDGAVTHAITRALNNRYAMGGSPYRRSTTAGRSDTVYLGAFRTQQLRDVGGWDERLTTNQDFDLNRRLGRVGAVWFDPSLEVGYVPRRTLRGIARQYHRFGRAKVSYWRLSGDRPRPRQVALLLLPPSVLAAFGGVLAGSRRSHRRFIVAAAASATALLVVDELGAHPGPPPPASRRLLSAAVMVTIGASWTAGVVGTVVSGRRTPREAHDPR